MKYNMTVQSKLLKNGRYATNTHANKQLVNCLYVFPNIKRFFIFYSHKFLKKHKSPG